MIRSRPTLVLLRLFTMLWLPFCCCQWQGVAAAWSTDDAAIAVSCGSACCQRDPGSETPSPESPKGDERCSFECCIRGELPLPAWEPPIDRRGIDATTDATIGVDAAPLARTVASTHAPPIDASPPWGLPVGVHVRIQV